MNTIFKLVWNRRLRGWVVMSELCKRRAKQSATVTSCVLLASLLMPSAAQSAVTLPIGNDAHDRTARAIRFSDLRSEGQSWYSVKWPKVLVGSQTVVVTGDMKTLDDFAFNEVEIVGDTLSRLFIRGNKDSKLLAMRASDFKGSVIVNGGTLQVDDSYIAAKLITVKNGAWLIGKGSATPETGDTRQRDHHIVIEHGGTLHVGTLDPASENQIQSFDIKGNLINRGDVWIHHWTGGAGNTLYVQGDYHGDQGSAVHMAIDESSGLKSWLYKNFAPTSVNQAHSVVHDELVIMGNSSGESRVSIVNLGAGGDAIDYSHGIIKLITVYGNSEAEFTLAQRAVAGAYEYRLIRGDSRYVDPNASKNWYLVSDASSAPANDGTSHESGASQSDEKTQTGSSNDPSNSPLLIAPPGEDPLSEDETNAAADAGDLSHSEDNATQEKALTTNVPFAPRTKVIRPEAGSYNSNALAANTMFQMNLNDRLSSYYQGEGHGHQGSAWVRYSGSRNHLNDSSGQLRTRGDKNTVMLGLDMLASSTTLYDQFTIGIMGGYGHYRGDTASRVSGYSSQGKVDGYSAGIYGTYQQNADTQTGTYLDSWLLWNRFNNTVLGDDLPREKYTSKGVTASAELGYNAKLAERNNVKYVLQPHVQVIYQNVRSQSLREANGTHVDFLNRGRIQTVLGLRAAAHIPSGMTSTITPHMEVNWLHSNKRYAVRMNGVETETGGGRNMGQLKLGVEGEINQRVSLDVALFRNQGNSGYHETGGNLALKYRY